MTRYFLFLCGLLVAASDLPAQTVVAIRGTRFTINGELTYTAASGFPRADAKLAGTLLNVRAVQAIFDDSHYPEQGSRNRPYPVPRAAAVSFD